MAQRITYTPKDKLFSTPLPNHAATYTVIPHREIAEHTILELNNAGFQIGNELYKGSFNGQLAYGIYTLDHRNDPDLSMMFAWSNTYDKSRRFRCAIGSQVNVSSNSMLHADLASYARKHTGNAFEEAKDEIRLQIAGAVEQYEILTRDKDRIVNQTLSKRQQCEILGVIVHEKELINLTQLAIIQRELKKPSFQYTWDQDSAFVLYNHIGHSLKEAHPAVWMDSQQELHRFFINEYGQIEDRLQTSQRAIENEILDALVAVNKKESAIIIPSKTLHNVEKSEELVVYL